MSITPKASKATVKSLDFIPGTMGNQLDGFKQGDFLFFKKITLEGKDNRNREIS